MSSAAKERKRAADREAQRVNRVRTKAYITQLERTIRDLTGPNPPDNLSQSLAQQQEKIHHLEDALRKIGMIAQGAGHPPSSSQATTESEPLTSGLVNNPEATARCNFFGFDLTCSDRERSYLAVLGSALTMIQDCSFTLAGSMKLIPRLYDDHFCIRAVVDGWKDTIDRFETDVVWELIQAIDEGLYYRADPVTRIAMFRIMRSLMLVRFCPFTQ